MQIGICQESLLMGAERMDILLPELKNKKIGLIINQTSRVGSNQTSLLDTLLSLQINVTKVFAPEHGFRGADDAGQTVKNSKDEITGIPILSIYGSNKKPTNAQLKDIDILIFDIQDVGARFYTYISTLYYIMETCIENNKMLIVCDRPNPNDFVDGPVLQKNCKSFVGMYPIPILHGLTIGELALMVNGEKWLSPTKNSLSKCNLKVIPMKGWKHKQEYILPIKPSPNLPNQQAIKLYPSLCLFEATNISIGRGTTFPFQVLGTTDKKYGSFNFIPRSLPGWDRSPLLQDKNCYGVDLRNVETKGDLNLHYFLSFFEISGKKDLFFTRPEWFDLLVGNKILRKQIISGMSETAIRKTWEKELTEYKKIRTKYLLYEDF